MAAGPSPAEVPSWRVDLLFLGFVVVSFLLTKGDHVLITSLMKRDKIGFIHIYEALKEEVLLVGIISLLLTGFQDALAAICVSSPKMDAVFPPFSERGDAGEGYPASYPADGEYAAPTPYGYPPPAAYRHLLEEGEHAGSSGRQLLAPGDDYGPCPAGTSQLFPVSVLHAVHIMLFLVAATQILYSCTVLILCLWKVSLWRKHELRAQQSPGLVSHLDGEFSGCGAQYRRNKRRAVAHLTTRATSNIATHYGVASLLMFNSVNGEQYIVMRHIFLQNLGLDNDFDFLEFVKESMEEEFASMVGVNSFMWMILFLWIALPPETYVSTWVPLLMLLLALVLGAKLSSVMLVFNHQARQAWAASAEGQTEIEAERLKHKFDDEGTAPAAPRSELSSYSKASESALGPVAEAAEEGAVVAPPVDASAPAVVVPPLPLPEMNMPSTLPEEDESEEAETARSERHRHREAAAGEESGTESEGGEGWMNVRVKRKGKWKNMKIDGSALRFAAGKGGRDWMESKYKYQDSASLFWRGKPHIILHLLQIVYFGMSMQLALSIFTVWLDLPVGYLLPVFGSLDEKHDLDAPLTAATVIFEVTTNLFILLWCSFNLLPVYALASTVGSHCPKSVLEFAQKTHIQPKLAKALEAVAMLNTAHLQEDVSDDESEFGEGVAPGKAHAEHLIDDIIDAHLDKSPPKAGGHVDAHAHRKQRSMQKLMGAMYSAQLRRYTEEAVVQQAAGGAPAVGDSDFALQAAESGQSFTQVQNNVFYEADDAEPSSRGVSDNGASGEGGAVMDPSPSQRLALKQEFLLSIVGRQEQLKLARAEDAADTPKVPPPGFSLGRNSAPRTAAAPASKPFSLSRRSAAPVMQHQQQQLPPSAVTTAQDATSKGFSLSRRSAAPIMQQQQQAQQPSQQQQVAVVVQQPPSRSFSLSRRSAAPIMQQQVVSEGGGSAPTGVPPPPGFSVARARSAEPRGSGGSQGGEEGAAFPSNPLFQSSAPPVRDNVVNAGLQLARVGSFGRLASLATPREQQAMDDSQVPSPSVVAAAPSGPFLRRSTSMGT